MDFKKYRSLQLLLLGLTYSCFYFSRLNMGIIHNQLALAYQWDYSSYGKIIAIAQLVYAIGVLFNGPIVDKIGSKISIMIGMTGAFFSNILMGITYYVAGNSFSIGAVKYTYSGSLLLSALTVVWATNYFFQTLGALSIVKNNSNFWQLKERGVASGIFGALIQIGRLLVATLCPVILIFLPWPWAFFVPAILLAVAFLFVWRFVKESPEEMGVQYFDEPAKHLSISETIKKVFTNKVVIISSLLAFSLGGIRNGIEHWYSRFFASQYHLPNNGLGKFLPYMLYSSLFPVAMILASLFAGPSSDKYFESKRFPIIAISMMGALCMFPLLSLGICNPWIAAILLILIMFFLQGANSMLMGCLPADISGRSAASSTAGFFDSSQYFGGSLMGTIVSLTLDHYRKIGNEWKYWPLLMIGPCIVALIISTTFWNKKPRMINETKTI